MTKKKKRKTPQVCLTIPSEIQEKSNHLIINQIDSDIFDGKPSLSKLVTVLLEITIDKCDLFNPKNISNSEELKNEVERILKL